MPSSFDSAGASTGFSEMPRPPSTAYVAATSSPVHVRGTLALATVVFVLSYLFLFLFMTRYPGWYDEGIIVTDAMRVASGQIPRRDFYVNYGPAQFYLLAGLFKAFGQSLLVERLYDISSSRSSFHSCLQLLRCIAADWSLSAVLFWR